MDQLNRTHKRLLSSNRVNKSKNVNKEDKKQTKQSWDTSHRSRSVDEYRQFRVNLESWENGLTEEEPQIDRWSEKHEGQTMDSSLHDRTRWKDSKLKTIRRRNRIDAKMDRNDFT